jgi:lipoprotein LprG
MTAMRKLLAVLATASVAATLVAACSSSSKQASSLPDAATLVKESSETTKDLNSVHLVLSVTGKIEKMPIKTLEGDLTTQPSTAAKGNAKITFGSSDIDVKFVVFDGDLYGALSGDTFDDYGPAEKIYDVSAILNPDRGVANILANFTDPKIEGRETLNGQDTVRVSGKAPADAVNKLAPQLGATEPMPCTVWIQENGDHQLVQAKLDKSSGNSIQMTLSNWNAPVTVEKPAGA